MIRSFRGSEAARIFRRERSRRLPPEFVRRAYRKLVMLDAAAKLQDLFVPPGNRLEKLRGDRRGCNSLRIDQQWRICFRWNRGEAHDVEIVDYH